MYTQCPECHVAFRITAEVLRQAAGKVRCGGCGVAFNALEYLSEEKPRAPVREKAEPQLPELTPDEPVELEADEPPAAISAAQSAALLKTLDQLAGEDIRIEDTGIEWRVIGADEEADAEPAVETAPRNPDLIGDTGSLKFFLDEDPESESIDEVLEESPTPVDEFLTAAPPEVDAPEIFAEMRFDDDTPLPDDFDLGAPAARPAADLATSEPIAVFEDMQVDLDLGDPDDWEELLGEMREAPPVQPTTAGGIDESPVEEGSAVGADTDVEELLDVDTQFAIQAEALGLDLGRPGQPVDEDLPDETEIEVLEEVDEELGTSIDDDLIAAAFEAEATSDADAEVADEEELIPIELESDADDAELLAEFRQVPVDERSLKIRLDGEDDEGEQHDDDNRADEHYVPEMTEEEKTINMLIDQDLLSIAVEDEDGFASTIVQVQPNRKVEKELERSRHGEEDEPAATDAEVEDSKPAKAASMVETIIMEGEVVSGMHDRDKSEKNRRLGEALKARRAEEELKKHAGSRVSKPGMLAAAIVLGLLLVLQFVHHSREALATIPAFNETIGPIYRMLGKPLTPTWDIKGWRFEATKGSTDDIGERLTIYSRVGNNSDASLPYPLVHVSLTDRFEDIIGSRVLEPAEYLGSDADPRELVSAGNTFNAVISIETPSPEATGFKLNVCYRLASGQLRCAIDDFK